MAAFNRFRLFHWLLAGFFLGAYLSGDDAESLHVWLGYGLIVLLVWRLLIVPLRLRGFPHLLPPSGQRRKPDLSGVGKWLTFAALGSFALASLVGLGMVDNGDVLSALPGVGPDVFGAASDIDFVGWVGDAEEVHEFFANLGLWLIGLHIGYVLLFRRKSVWPMLRGVRKSAPSSAPSTAPSPASPSPSALAPASTAQAVSEFTRLRIASRQAETADSCSFVLQVPPAQRARFAAQPGQFLTLKVPCGEPALLRCYSLSQRPQAKGALRLTIKRVPGGRASNWLLDHLQVGDSIETLPPTGVFVPRNLEDDLLLLGAGSGITPLMAILQAALVEGSGRVFLFYANRDAASLIFADELAEWSVRYPERLQLRIWLDAEQGVPSAAAIAEKMAGWPLAEAFVCGPQAFMEGASAALGELGIESARIHLERFGAAPSRSEATPERNGRHSRLRVALAGRRHELSVLRGEVLLEAMEQAGLQPPSACRSGVCAACKCRVVEGSVSMRSNQVLSESEVRQGWALACQAEPSSAELQVEY